MAMMSKTASPPPSPYAQRLEALRRAMMAEKIDGFLVPRTDAHLGEYVPASGERLAWLTGFTGSAGLGVVLADTACVFSDGRYTIQLKQQVDERLYQCANSTDVKWPQWIIDHVGAGRVLGYDPHLHTHADIVNAEKTGLVLKPLSQNLIDPLWTDRPAIPATPVTIFDIKFAGVSHTDKIRQVAEILSAQNIDTFILTQPDSIAWLLNIRAQDMPHIPAALSYVLISKDQQVRWYIDPARVSFIIRQTLGKNIHVIDPGKMHQNMVTDIQAGHIFGFDLKRSAVFFKEYIEHQGGQVVDMKDPCVLPKALKNPAEQNAMRTAHVRDGVAMVNFLYWARTALTTPEHWTEITIAEKLRSFRAQAPSYRGDSFDTIAGIGANGAIVHYRATPEHHARLHPDTFLLLDSGAQYEDGTTDITRTISIGNISPEMRENFTLVLKGHIAVACATFSQGTPGADIDALARAPLKARGRDYAHGTGHGVGCYLSVHEEAASLSTRGIDPVLPGMIISNEPGYYQEGAYGIRIENLVLAQEKGVCSKTGQNMIGFDTITLCPIDRTAIVPEFMTPDERQWINTYHRHVRETLSPFLSPDVAGFLGDVTSPI
jgi:Xaa-Pro aminopeptidase